jgi:hypothetical protein
VYSETEVNGDQYDLAGINWAPVAISFLPGQRQGFLTAGVGIYAVRAPDFVGGSTSGQVTVSLFGSLPSGISGDVTGALGVLTTTDAVLWEVKRSPEGGAVEDSIIRTTRLDDPPRSTVWVSGLRAGVFGAHDVPPLVGDDTWVFFTDGKAIYARATSDVTSVQASSLLPIYVDGTDTIRGLAYRKSVLYALTSSGRILAGPVVRY